MAIFEPPEELGRVIAAKPVIGPEIIRNIPRLRELASAAVKEFRLADRPAMRLFAEVQPLEPMLVHMNGEIGRPYYLVPFRSHRGEIQAAMILNAYTGEYEQSIVLSKDCYFKFLTKEKAVKLTVDKFRVSPKWLSPPHLIFIPSVETPNRFFPVWHMRDIRQRLDIYVTPRAEAVRTLATTEEEFWSRFK